MFCFYQLSLFTFNTLRWQSIGVLCCFEAIHYHHTSILKWLLGRLACSFFTVRMKNTALDRIINYKALNFLVGGMLQCTLEQGKIDWRWQPDDYLPCTWSSIPLRKSNSMHLLESGVWNSGGMPHAGCLHTQMSLLAFHNECQGACLLLPPACPPRWWWVSISTTQELTKLCPLMNGNCVGNHENKADSSWMLPNLPSKCTWTPTTPASKSPHSCVPL